MFLSYSIIYMGRKVKLRHNYNFLSFLYLSNNYLTDKIYDHLHSTKNHNPGIPSYYAP